MCSQNRNSTVSCVARIESSSKSLSVVVIFFILTVSGAQEAGKTYSTFRGDYLGQGTTGGKPEPFVPEIFSPWGDYGYHVVTPVFFSSDNRELFFSEQKLPAVEGRGCSILYMQQVGGLWTQPQKVSFSGGWSDKVTFLSPDGKRVHFNSARPVSGHGSPKDYDIWQVMKKGGKWSEPVRFGNPINTEYDDLGGLMTRNRAIYFSSNRPGGMGGFDIYVAQQVGGDFIESNLGQDINTKADEYVVYIAQDESFVIFCRDNTLDTMNSGLYVSYNDAPGQWTSAKSMGDHISSARAATVSPDGKYLFLLGCGEGICWLTTDIIEYLKTEDLEISKMLLNAVADEDMPRAVRLYHELKKKHAAYIDLNEYLLNQKGQDLLEAGQLTEAITLFKINIALFPDSWNVHDSMGEAYFQAGSTDLAMQSYERSLELNPNNKHAIRALERIRAILHD